MNGQSCGTCRYYKQFPTRQTQPGLVTPEGTSDLYTGYCRRYPPSVPDTDAADAGYPNQSQQPDTNDEYGWCGEYVPANPETISEGATYLARLVVIGDKTAAYALVDKLVEERTEGAK